jgi:hypothetical protein
LRELSVIPEADLAYSVVVHLGNERAEPLAEKGERLKPLELFR